MNEQAVPLINFVFSVFFPLSFDLASDWSQHNDHAKNNFKHLRFRQEPLLAGYLISVSGLVF